MPVLCATVSSLPSPNIFRYQLVSISLMSAALCLCCAPCFPDEEPRLASWELLRWALVPLREATECLRWEWGGPCPPMPPPLLRAANMAPEGAPSPQGQSSESKVERRSCWFPSVSKSFFMTDHFGCREWSRAKRSFFCLAVTPLSLSTLRPSSQALKTCFLNLVFKSVPCLIVLSLSLFVFLPVCAVLSVWSLIASSSLKQDPGFLVSSLPAVA